MSDFNSSLPVRTQTNGDVAVKLVDGTIVSNALTIDSSGKVTVKLDDAAGTGITSTLIGAKQSLDVNIANTTPVPVSGTITTLNGSVSNTAATPPAQATYVGGSVTTTAPTYTTGQMDPLSLTTNGLLRVDGSNVTQPVSIAGTVAENLTQVGGSSIALGQTTMSASLPVVIASNQTTLNTKDVADGPVAPGTAAVNSLLTGAVYTSGGITLTTGQQAALQLDSAGRLLVDGSAVTQPVSGTITANQGTSPWLTKDNSDGPVTPGTVAANSMLIGGQYNTALPTLTSTQQSAFQLDASGRLIIRPLTSGTDTVTSVQSGVWAQNITQIGGTTPSATNALPSQIATGGAFVSSTNPLPVIIDPAGAGVAVDDHKAASAIVVGSTDNHLYTTLGTVGLRMQQVIASGSGKFKCIVGVETGVGTGVYTTIFTGFNSTAQPSLIIPVPSNRLVATGLRVQVAMTNLDLLAQDLYSTISGFYN